MKPCFFIFGFGYTAEFLARHLLSLNFEVIGTTRDKEKSLNSHELHYKLIDFNEIEIKAHLNRATHILISTPASDNIGDPVLAYFSDLITQYASHIQWIGYLSSTGVYGDHQGAWVDETSSSQLLGTQGQRRLDAENAWLSFAKKQQLPLHIFRLAGIYGPKRNALERILAGKKESIYKEGQVFSRVHVEDIVSVILASIKYPKPYSIYNVADNEPAPSHEVDAYAASLLNHPALALIPYNMATLSPMERQFYSNNRRVSNTKIKKELLVDLQYPTYREGLNCIAISLLTPDK